MSDSSTVAEFVCQGGCHCGAVCFEVELPATVDAYRCNCSICRKSGFIHVFVMPPHFRLLQGEDALREYQFHTRTARHLFCRHCGVKSYYIPRSHPDGFSINLNCIDLPDAIKVNLGDFDGANWSSSIARLHRSRQEGTDG